MSLTAAKFGHAKADDRFVNQKQTERDRDLAGRQLNSVKNGGIYIPIHVNR